MVNNDPEPDWVAELVRCFEATSADLVTGTVRMQAEQPELISAVEAYDLVTGIRGWAGTETICTLDGCDAVY